MTERCDGKCDSCSKADTCTDRKKQIFEQERLLKLRMSQIKHKIAVISGKGGVGKSTVTANLAIALATSGYHVGVLDADIHGPCIPKMLGMRGEEVAVGPPGAFPAVGPYGVRVVSMDFLLQSDDTPVIWRGPIKMGVIRQFLSDFVWGPLDFLLIDLPPGTGDEPLSIMQLIPEMDGAIIVTTPSETSQIVVKKAIAFARQLKTPIVGVIENMSGFICPRCGFQVDIFKRGGGLTLAQEASVRFLGSIPIDPSICEASDGGASFILGNPPSPAAKAFREIVARVEEYVRLRSESVRSESDTGAEERPK
jgi:Mrp family chromosome partitioning ATPase